MYLIIVGLLLFVFPVVCFIGDALIFNAGSSSLMSLIGKWFTFWAVGVRLLLAGLSQIFRPQFTAQTIFGLRGSNANPIVRELGFANLAFGTLGILSLTMSPWVVPAALAGGLFYGLAAIGHMMRGHRNDNEQISLMSDLFVFAVLATFVSSRLL